MLHTPEELDPKDQMGAKRAARRKLEQELGIKQDQLPLDLFKFVTRIHYKASSDGLWGEHESTFLFLSFTFSSSFPLSLFLFLEANKLSVLCVLQLTTFSL